MPKEHDEKIEGGRHYLAWACPYESRNGRVCGRVHWVEWDPKYDSPCDDTSLYCGKHAKKEEQNGNSNSEGTKAT